MKYLLTIGAILFIIGCKPMMDVINDTDNAISKRYDEFLGEDEVKISSDYLSLISKTTDGRYIVRKFYPDNKIMIEYTEFTEKALVNKTGTSKSYSDYGVLTKECSFSDGKKTGLEQIFNYKTGKPISLGAYQNDKKHGPWKIYKNGRLHEELVYVDGVKEGEYKIYSAEGQLATEGVFKQDSLIETKVIIEKEWTKLKNAPEKDGRMPLFGDGCKELTNYDEKKKCSEQKMLQFIYKNLKYPANAREKNVEGMAIAQFVVDKTGRVTEIDVVKGICDEIRNEVTRVIVKMPYWVPGEQDGEKVKVLYTLPVRFKLE